MTKEGQDPDKKPIAQLVKTLAAFPELNPNPLLMVDFAGKITFSNGAVQRVLEELRLKDPALFLPKDMPRILEIARQRKETWFYREVCLGKKIFGEDLHVDESKELLRIYGIDITAWKKAEIELKKYRGHLEDQVRRATEAMREKEEHFQAVVESAADAIISADSRGQIILWNKGAETLFGYTAAEALGQSINLILPKKYLKAHAEALERLRGGGKLRLLGQAIDLDGRRKDGSKFPLEHSFNTWKTEKGIFFSAILRDISKRKQAEAQLQKLRHHQAVLLNSTWEGMLGLDNHENVTFANRAAARLLGYNPEELVGRHSHSTWHHSKADGSHYPPEECKILAAIRKGVAICCTQEVFWRQDGSSFPVEYSVAPILNHEVGGGVLTFWDISRRCEAEALSRSLIETSPLGVYILQEDRFVLTNHWFHSITGFNGSELADLNYRNLVHPDDRFAVRASALMMLKGESFSPYEYRHITKGGETKWIMESVTSIIYRGKRATLGYFMDITERKLLEDKLLHAQKMEAVGRLAGGVAHDFNNLLTAIMGYVDMLQDSLHPADPLYRQVQEIGDAADRAAALTRQLLAFSRKQILQPKILNLNVVVQDTENMLRRMIGEDIELATKLDPALGNIKADPGQIEQVLMNLAVNARDAMPMGGKLTFETSNITFTEPHDCKFEIASPGYYAMLAVTDTGMGMDAATQDHLFEPFFTTKEMGKGTGLGLSTVYGIVKQSEGCIEVLSQPGLGATFKIYFPLVQEAASAAVTAPATGLEGSETILVVEDDEIVGRLITDIFKMHGYRVLSANNPGAALLLSEQHRAPIHLMVTDVVMPIMSGRDLAERLAPLHPEMKVLYMSGYTEDIISHQGVLEENMLFIQKPFNPRGLVQKVRQVLDS